MEQNSPLNHRAMWRYLTRNLIHYLQNNCRNLPMKKRKEIELRLVRRSAQSMKERLVVFIPAQGVRSRKSMDFSVVLEGK